MCAATGALSCGGLLLGLALGTGHDVRRLERLPIIREIADIHSIEREGGLKGREVAATGSIASREVFNDTLSRKPAVATLVKHAETHRTRVRHGWEEGERPIKETRRTLPLGLELANHQTLDLKPSDARDVTPVLEHAVTISHPTQNNLLQSLLETSVGYIVTGRSEQEFILPPHTQITAIGEITSQTGLRGESYAMQPFGSQFAMSRLSIEQQIKHLERWTKALKTAAYVFGATGLVFLGAAFALKGYRYYRRRKRRKQEDKFLQHAAERHAALEGTNTTAEDSPYKWQCNVCWESDVEQTVFPACGHVAACKSCARHLTRCPICRTASSPRQIYYC